MQLGSLLKDGGFWGHPNGAAVELVGFSKGGVVLNQLLAELGCWQEMLPDGNLPLDEAGLDSALPGPISSLLKVIVLLHQCPTGHKAAWGSVSKGLKDVRVMMMQGFLSLFMFLEVWTSEVSQVFVEPDQQNMWQA